LTCIGDDVETVVELAVMPTLPGEDSFDENESTFRSAAAKSDTIEPASTAIVLEDTSKEPAATEAADDDTDNPSVLPTLNAAEPTTKLPVGPVERSIPFEASRDATPVTMCVRSPATPAR
jgi:hypothetical protein